MTFSLFLLIIMRRYDTITQSKKKLIKLLFDERFLINSLIFINISFNFR